LDQIVSTPAIACARRQIMPNGNLWNAGVILGDFRRLRVNPSIDLRAKFGDAIFKRLRLRLLS
jgi:hypothetical protein